MDQNFNTVSCKEKETNKLFTVIGNILLLDIRESILWKNKLLRYRIGSESATVLQKLCKYLLTYGGVPSIQNQVMQLFTVISGAAHSDY